MAWFEDWFNTPYYHILYSNRDYAEAESFIKKITEFLQIPQNSEIIDLACGKGRHSVFLNKLGYKVLGLDLSEESIKHNHRLENPTLRFAVHDMRNQIYPEVTGNMVDAVMNLFTSFGYFDSEDEDRAVLNSVSNALKKDGWFVLDFLNKNFVENTLVTESVVSRGGIDFKISKKIEDGFVFKDIRFTDKGQDFHFFERVKLHTLANIKNFAIDAGLGFQKIFGDYNLNEYDAETSPRNIVIFKKL